jgi:cytochrome c oxidase subunit 2
MIILLGVGNFSIIILYWIDNLEFLSSKFKIIGHQWFWEYRYIQCNYLSENIITSINTIERYISNSLELDKGVIRLIETHYRPILPYENIIQTVVSREDVLHSWTIPVLGVKTDATPGRLNVINFIRLYPGIQFGQCSEICGANHRFIPIILEIIRLDSCMYLIRRGIE